MSKGMEQMTFILVCTILFLAFLGGALYAGTDFFENVKKDVGNFQSCESGVISSLGGKDARCTSDKSCADVQASAASDTYYFSIGQGWGCKDQYCCLGTDKSKNPASSDKIREASCSSTPEGSITLIKENLCINAVDPRILADQKIGFRFTPSENTKKSPCSFTLQILDTIVININTACSAETRSIEIINGYSPVELLKLHDSTADLSRLNGGGRMTATFKWSGGEATKTYEISPPSVKICAPTPQWSMCDGKPEGFIYEGVTSGVNQKRPCTITDSSYHCKLSDAVTGSGTPVDRVCYHIQYAPDNQYDPIFIDTIKIGYRELCKYMDVSDGNCYVDGAGTISVYCRRTGSPTTCIQEYAETVRSPECKSFTQRVEITDWLMTEVANNPVKYTVGSVPYLLYRYYKDETVK